MEGMNPEDKDKLLEGASGAPEKGQSEALALSQAASPAPAADPAKAAPSEEAANSGAAAPDALSGGAAKAQAAPADPARAQANAQDGAKAMEKAKSDLGEAAGKLSKVQDQISKKEDRGSRNAKAKAPAEKGEAKDDGSKGPLGRKEHPFLRAIYAGLSLAVISAACCLFVLKADQATSAVIERNENNAIAKTVSKLLPKEAMENAKFQCHLVDDARVGRKMRLYTSEKEGIISGYVMTYSTNRGYAVPLVLIAGFTADKKVYKADIFISHETPGLGDKVDRNHGDFLDMMNGKGLEASWDVKKFGGDFDYITGSTVTSRAVVTATGDALSALNDINVQDLRPCRRR